MSKMEFSFEPAAALRESRLRRLLHATLSSVRTGDIEIVVRSVSPRGLGASTKAQPPRTGDAVTMQLPGDFVLSGIVRWVSGNAFGIALDFEFDPAVLEDAIRHQHGKQAAAHQWQVQSRHRVAVTDHTVKLRRI